MRPTNPLGDWLTSLSHSERALLSSAATTSDPTRRRQAVVTVLSKRGYDETAAPDFVIPDDEPAVIIESKVAEDGGTARDKAARIQALALAGRRPDWSFAR